MELRTWFLRWREGLIRTAFDPQLPSAAWTDCDAAITRAPSMRSSDTLVPS
jgi:hypothetical protein